MDPYGGGDARRARRRKGVWALVVVIGLVFLLATMGDAQTGTGGAFPPVAQLDPSVRGRICDALRSVQARLASFPQATAVAAALLQSFGCSGPMTPGSSTTSTGVAPTTSTTGTSPPTTSNTLPPCISGMSTTTVPCQPTTSTVFVPSTTSTTLGPGQTTTSTTLGFCATTTTTSGGGPQLTTTTAFPPTTIPCIPRP